MQGFPKSPIVVCSILEREGSLAKQGLDQAPQGCGLVEIRADLLRTAEIESLVRSAGRPVVVTIRRAADGGRFQGTEAERRLALLAALDQGAAFVDVELDGSLADLAGGPLADRVILSHHGMECDPQSLLSSYRRMAATPAALFKIVPSAAALAQLSAIRDLLHVAGRDERRLAAFAMGRAGAISRLLAPSWGSWATYGALRPGGETAPGQFTASEMLEIYDVLKISSATRRFGLIGSGVFGSPSPAIHRAGYLRAGIDARYFPIELDRLDQLEPLLDSTGGVGLEAFGVTIPFKEEVARRCRAGDTIAGTAGAVNTVLVSGDDWHGFNTDAPAAIAAVRNHLDPAGAKVAILGAGGTGRALAVAFRSSGSRVTLFNRDVQRAEEFAAQNAIAGAPLTDLSGADWEILVNATPLGRAGEEVVPEASLNGELVLDACYASNPTPLVRAALQRGLKVVDGLELLAGQAVLQFQQMTGILPDGEPLLNAGREWLKERTA